MNFYYKFSILIIFAICCLAQLANAGKIYTWVDENGQVQYSDRPPMRGSYMVKPAQIGSGINNATGQDGLRYGEKKLLGKYNSRKADIQASRRAASRKYENRKRDCVAERKKYSNALRSPRSRGIEYKERAKKIYQRLKEICF
jgi:hypothetical protein